MYSDRLKELRKNKHLTQEQLGKALNIATSTVSMYENGSREPDLQTLINLSKFYEVTADYILGLSDKPYLTDMTPEQILKESLLILSKSINKINPKSNNSED